MDLSTSLGVFRDYTHPRFTAALEKTLAAAAKHNRVAGILLPSGAETRRTDVMLLKSAAQQLAQQMRNA